MAHPFVFVALALAAVGVASSSPKKKPTPMTPPALPPGTNVPNQYGLIGCDAYHTPSGKASPRAVSGFATHPDYQWCYQVREGDSAGSITELFFGPDQGWRYTELLAANPQKLTKGTTVSPDGLGDELNFASLATGEVLYLPRTWNQWIDQTGIPRSKVPASMVV